jgi:hypothetical protein
MSDFLAVALTMVGLVYLAWFVFKNDGDANARPDKTLLAMEEDKARPQRRWLGIPRPPR